MEIQTKQIELRKLVANDGKVLREKTVQYDEDGNEIPRETFKEIYLAVNADADLYEEISEETGNENNAN